MTAYFGTVMASTLHYLCLWLAFGCCKNEKTKVLLLNAELLFKDMPKGELQTKFEHIDLFEEHGLYSNIWNIMSFTLFMFTHYKL